jgi:hypothetical protein
MKQNQIFIEVINYCLSKLREIEGTLILMQSEVEEAQEKKDLEKINALNKKFDVMETKLHVYMHLIQHFKKIQDDIIYN